MKKPLVVLTLLLLAVILSAGCVQDSQSPSMPGGTGNVISVNPQIDTAESDSETTHAFLISPTYEFVFTCLKYHNDTAKITEDIRSQMLYDFPYSTADGEIIIQDITIGDLLNGMETYFSGYGWTGEYITCIVGEPRYTHDLENAYAFVQYIAKRDGFEKTIPLLFIEPMGMGLATGYEKSNPTFIFAELETLPEDALIVLKLTEEDYEKYPVLRNIPEPIYTDKSPLSNIYTHPGYLDREDVRDFMNRYGSSSTYIEHNGKIYH